ncbi:IclR family transcriptional regulator [Arthrobacter halodurans]|jgi:DNA-binding IclR family transcriptional regulator|uniref:IclR family transcriptional regulator n=1 Tax=Arthrobacter halodurans TaxID=516699 RepID=A0ABV4UP08_9MICC
MRNEQEDTGRPPHLIGSVDHALTVLLLLQERGELRVRDVARELGVAQSTAHRLLATLAWRGFVVQDRGGRTYRAGNVLVGIALASIKDLDVRRQARTHMQRLARELHETVNLIVLEHGGCRFIEGVEGDRMVRVTPRTGTLLPASSTSGGKVLLAELDDDRVRALFGDGLRTLTDRTIRTVDELLRELAAVRSRGFATNLGETEAGLHAVAVPVRDRSGHAVAALAVAAPSGRLNSQTIPVALERLRSTAEAIRADLLS